MIIRCVFSKAWPNLEPKVALPVGRFSQDKKNELAPYWARTVERKRPSLNVAKESGLVIEPKEDIKGKEYLNREVDLTNLRELKKGASDAPDPELMAPKFSKGDEDTVCNMMTWNISVPGSPKFRKDIMDGAAGVIAGWADIEER